MGGASRWGGGRRWRRHLRPWWCCTPTSRDLVVNQQQTQHILLSQGRQRSEQSGSGERRAVAIIQHRGLEPLQERNQVHRPDQKNYVDSSQQQHIAQAFQGALPGVSAPGPPHPICGLSPSPHFDCCRAATSALGLSTTVRGKPCSAGIAAQMAAWGGGERWRTW